MHTVKWASELILVEMTEETESVLQFSIWLSIRSVCHTFGYAIFKHTHTHFQRIFTYLFSYVHISFTSQLYKLYMTENLLTSKLLVHYNLWIWQMMAKLNEMKRNETKLSIIQYKQWFSKMWNSCECLNMWNSLECCCCFRCYFSLVYFEHLHWT